MRKHTPHPRLPAATALAALSLLAAGSLRGQTVLLRLNPEPGHVARQLLEQEVTVRSPMIPTDGPTFTVSSYQTMTVREASESGVELAFAVDSSAVVGGAMPGMGAPDLTGTSATITLDPRWRVLAVEAGSESEELLSQMQTSLELLELPEDEVGVGDSWSGSHSVNMPDGTGAEMELGFEITYTLTSLSGDEAHVSLDGPVAVTGSLGGMPVDASGTLEASVVIDVGTGLFLEQESALSMELSMSGMSIGMETRSTMRTLP